LKDEIPNEQERIKWILENQVYACAPSDIIYNIVKEFVYGNLEGISTKNLIQLDTMELASEGKLAEKIYKAFGDENMKFDVIIGNPPYQDETKGTSDNPVYHLFMEESFKIASKVMFITPARFLFNAGKTPKSWNEKILNDEHTKVVFYERDSAKIFPNTDIKGGVTITYRNVNRCFGKIGTFTEYAELNSILDKVLSKSNFESLVEHIYLQNRFNLEALYSDYPNYKDIIGSNGRERRLTTSIINQLSIFTEKPSTPNDVKILGLIRNSRVYRFIPAKYLEGHANLDMYKVILPKSNGTGALGEVLSSPILGNPLLGYTQSFISVGAFETEYEGDAALKYIKSKLVRALLGTLKVTQDNNRETWRNVPFQDFTPDSDIDWSKSISEIDQQLYKKYNLSKEEIDFIEKNVQPME